MIRPQRTFVEGHATWRQDETALIFPDEDRTYTFAEFDDAANKLANALHDRGIRMDDRVGMVLYNTKEFVITQYACHKLGAIPAALNTRVGPGDMEYIFDLVNPEVIVYDPEIADKVLTAEEGTVRDHDLIHAGTGVHEGEAFEDVLESETNHRPPEFEKLDTDTSHILFTSGTTGRPKGVVHSLRSAKERIEGTFFFQGQSENDRLLTLLPFYHGAGLTGAMQSSVSAGATLIGLKDTSVENTLAVFEEHKPTHVWSVPTLTERFVEHDGIEEYDFSSVEYWIHTGEVLSERQAVEFSETLTPNIYNYYGSSEAGLYTSLRPEDLPEHAGTTGKPGPGVEVRVVEVVPDGHADPDQVVPQGDKGEIIIRTDSIFVGYFEDLSGTREVLNDGWYYNNDVGYVDEDGFITVTGRADDVIVSGGELISPKAVEDALEDHPEVDEAIVVGVPDEEWTHRVKGIVGGGNVSAKELDEWCQEHDDLGRFMRPREYEFVDGIEHTGSGKKRRSIYRPD